MFGFIKKWGSSKINKTKEGAKKITNLKEINKNKDSIMEMIDDNLNPYNQKVARNETFENAYKRLDLDEDTLEKVYYSHCLRFYLALIIGCVTVILAIKYVIGGDYWALLPTIACLSLVFAQCVNASFRSYQIIKRELMSFNSWVESKVYFPTINYKKPVEKKQRKNKENKEV